MKKRNLKYMFDRVYWHLLCLMPFLLYALNYLAYQLVDVSSYLPTFMEFISMQGLDFISDNIVYTSFTSIFGSSGLVPLFYDNSPVLWYATYVVLLHIVKLCVEFLTFLPVLCHKFYDKLMEM